MTLLSVGHDDEAYMKARVPYCLRVELQRATDPAESGFTVRIVCNFKGGILAKLDCSALPSGVPELADIIEAASCQALAARVTEGTFQYTGSTRIVRRAGTETGEPWASGPPLALFGAALVADFPTIEQVKKRQPNVVSVGPKLIPKPSIDREKMSAATQAMADLMNVFGDDDG